MFFWIQHVVHYPINQHYLVSDDPVHAFRFYPPLKARKQQNSVLLVHKNICAPHKWDFANMFV